MRRLSIIPAALALVGFAFPAAAEVAYRAIGSGPAGANLLKNPGFEMSADTSAPWQRYEQGHAIDGAVARSGRRSVRVHLDDSQGSTGASYRLELNQKQPMPLLITGWSRAKDVSGGAGNGYSLYLDVVYADGTPHWGITSPFGTGTHDWERGEILFVPRKSIKSLSLYCLFRGHTGTAWFDDIHLSQIDGGTVATLDFTPVHPVKRARPTATAATVSAGGVSVGLAQDGAVSRITCGGDALPLSDAPSGWMALDVAAKSDFHRSDGRIGGGTVRQTSLIKPLSLKMEASCAPDGDHPAIEFRLKATDTSGKDRAMSFVYALPLDLVGWTWCDDLYRSRKIEPRMVYQNTSRISAGKTGLMARYPIAAVAGPKHGIAVATPLDSPRICRLQYDAANRCLLVCFDAALVPDMQASPSQAGFRFLLYRFDPQWGFRSALARYYTLRPEHFRKRVPKEGIWMAFAKISQVQGHEDFGFAFKEGNNEPAWDDEHGYLTFRYTEPQTYWLRMPKGAPRSYEGCVGVIEKNLAGGNAAQKLWAQATMASGCKDPRGRYHLWVQDAPWCDGCVCALNPDPDLPGAATKGKLSYTIADAGRRYGPDAKGVLDGEYLDSLEGWSGVQNYRREHFRYANVPLAYDRMTRRACILNVFSIYEFVEFISADVHRRGKLMMANGAPMRYYWHAAHLDLMGSEMHWKRGGKYQPPDEEELAFRRAICGTKPWLILQNTPFKDFLPEDSRRYMMHAAFWGFFPSFFSANASTDHYFTDPKYYNRDRHLFRQIIPVVRRIAKAGWEPVTLAHVKPRTARAGDIRIERFGRPEDSNLHYTVLNKTATVQRVGVISPAKASRVIELWSGQALELTATPAGTAVTVDVPPGECVVLKWEG